MSCVCVRGNCPILHVLHDVAQKLICQDSLQPDSVSCSSALLPTTMRHLLLAPPTQELLEGDLAICTYGRAGEECVCVCCATSWLHQRYRKAQRHLFNSIDTWRRVVELARQLTMLLCPASTKGKPQPHFHMCTNLGLAQVNSCRFKKATSCGPAGQLLQVQEGGQRDSACLLAVALR